jgi:hypothetical protein
MVFAIMHMKRKPDIQSSNDAAPTALSYNEAFFYPTEMLRIPIGLRICRPETGLVYLLKS